VVQKHNEKVLSETNGYYPLDLTAREKLPVAVRDERKVEKEILDKNDYGC